MKKSYPIEDQINDCFSYLRVALTKDAHDMSEYELLNVDLRNFDERQILKGFF